MSDKKDKEIVGQRYTFRIPTNIWSDLPSWAESFLQDVCDYGTCKFWKSGYQCDVHIPERAYDVPYQVRKAKTGVWYYETFGAPTSRLRIVCHNKAEQVYNAVKYYSSAELKKSPR